MPVGGVNAEEAVSVSVPSPRVANVLTAVLSGSVLYTVFKEQIPDHDGHESSYPLFLGGAAIFVAFHLGIEAFGG